MGTMNPNRRIWKIPEPIKAPQITPPVKTPAPEKVPAEVTR